MVFFVFIISFLKITNLFRSVVPSFDFHGALLLVKRIVVHVQSTCEGKVASRLPTSKSCVSNGDPEVFPGMEHSVRAEN